MVLFSLLRNSHVIHHYIYHHVVDQPPCMALLRRTNSDGKLRLTWRDTRLSHPLCLTFSAVLLVYHKRPLTHLLKLALSLSPQGGSIQNIDSQRCLELVESRQSEFTFQLAIQDCTDQKWTITNVLTVLPQ